MDQGCELWRTCLRRRRQEAWEWGDPAKNRKPVINSGTPVLLTARSRYSVDFWHHTHSLAFLTHHCGKDLSTYNGLTIWSNFTAIPAQQAEENYRSRSSGSGVTDASLKYQCARSNYLSHECPNSVSSSCTKRVDGPSQAHYNMRVHFYAPEM